MSGRALRLAAMSFLVCGVAGLPARAQNLEAGKSPSQIFANGCAACHRSPRGLLKTVPPGALPGFLRQHYTTSGDMAASLSAYLISNGAVDRRSGASVRQGREAGPTSDGRTVQGEPAARPRRHGRKSRYHVRPEVEDRDSATHEDGLRAGGHRNARHGKKAKRSGAVEHEPQNEAPHSAVGDNGRAESAAPPAAEARKPESANGADPIRPELSRANPAEAPMAKPGEPKPSESTPVETAAPASDGEHASSGQK